LDAAVWRQITLDTNPVIVSTPITNAQVITAASDTAYLKISSTVSIASFSVVAPLFPYTGKTLTVYYIPTVVSAGTNVMQLTAGGGNITGINLNAKFSSVTFVCTNASTNTWAIFARSLENT
jgi:hypothetical protein